MDATAATRDAIARHWAAANARDWNAFAQLLHAHLRYDVPQTREYIEGAGGYLDLFRTWPGDWRAHVTTLVADGERGVSIVSFEVGGEVMTGISVFRVSAGRVAEVVDYWPEPYEPPSGREHLVERY